MFRHCLFGLLIVASCVKFGYGTGPVCTNADEIGQVNAATTTDANTDVTYIFSDTAYDSPCCGIIDKFKARLRSGTKDVTQVTWQVWAPDPIGQDNNWVLVGQETFTITTTNGDQDFTFSTRVSVDTGYRFGWHAPVEQPIGYKTGGSLQRDTKYLLGHGAWAVDTAQDWGSVTTVYDGGTGRDYPYEVHFEPGSTPVFTTTAQRTISDTEAANTAVLTTTAVDSDIGDAITFSIDAACDTEFEINSTTGEITVDAGGLTTANGTVGCVVTATDLCGNTATNTHNIHIINPPPTWVGPYVEFRSEDLAAVDLVFNISITDNGPTTCNLDASVDPTWPFVTQRQSYGLDALIITTPTNFNFTDKNTYRVPVECNDGVTTMTSTYTIYLEQNWTPQFTNLQNSTNITSQWDISDDVFCVEAWDKENDDLTYSMECESFVTVCPFYIVDSGCIKLSMHITNLTSPLAGYDVFVTVRDAKNAASPATLTINVLDLNTPVSCLYMPASIAVYENNTIGNVIYTATYYDVDVGQAHTWRQQSSPASAYFDIDNNGNVNLTTIVDYEDPVNIANLWTYDLTLTAADIGSSCSGTVRVEFLNINENPVFASDTYGIPASEPNDGTVLDLPVWGVTDQDSVHTNQNLRYTLACPSYAEYFSMDLTTGQITMSLDWDLDNGLPGSVTCQVFVTDAGGLSDNATLIISFTDVNDNAPYFTAPFYQFFINYYSLTGNHVGDVVAIDNDVGIFGNLTYTLTQNAVNGTNQFSLYQNGTIFLATAPLEYNSVHYMTVIASDIGPQTATASVTVYISGTTTAPPTTTTWKYKKFLEMHTNLPWLVVLCLALLGGCVFSTWLAWTCRGPQGCLAFWQNLRSRCKPIQYQRKHRHGKKLQNPGTEGSQRKSVRPYPGPEATRSWRTGAGSRL